MEFNNGKIRKQIVSLFIEAYNCSHVENNTGPKTVATHTAGTLITPAILSLANSGEYKCAKCEEGTQPM